MEAITMPFQVTMPNETMQPMYNKGDKIMVTWYEPHYAPAEGKPCLVITQDDTMICGMFHISPFDPNYFHLVPLNLDCSTKKAMTKSDIKGIFSIPEKPLIDANVYSKTLSDLFDKRQVLNLINSKLQTASSIINDYVTECNETVNVTAFLLRDVTEELPELLEDLQNIEDLLHSSVNMKGCL